MVPHPTGDSERVVMRRYGPGYKRYRIIAGSTRGIEGAVVWPYAIQFADGTIDDARWMIRGIDR